MIVTDVGFPAKTFSRLNVFHNFSLSACPVFTASILHVHFDSAILGLYLFYFVIPIRKSGLVCTLNLKSVTFLGNISTFPCLKIEQWEQNVTDSLCIWQRINKLLCLSVSRLHWLFLSLFCFQISLTFSCIFKIL